MLPQPLVFEVCMRLEPPLAICLRLPQELQIARETLIQRLGKEFARAAAGNKDRYVSSRVCSGDHTLTFTHRFSPRLSEQFQLVPHRPQYSMISSPE